MAPYAGNQKPLVAAVSTPSKRYSRSAAQRRVVESGVHRHFNIGVRIEGVDGGKQQRGRCPECGLVQWTSYGIFWMMLEPPGHPESSAPITYSEYRDRLKDYPRSDK